MSEQEEQKKREKPETIEALKFISEIHRNQFIERRKHEWKPYYAIALLVVLTIYALLNYNISYVKWYCILPFIVMSVSILIYLGFSAKANNINKDIAEKAERSILKLIKYEYILPKKPENFIGKIKHYLLSLSI